MHKEKDKKSAPSDVEFPKGDWPFWFTLVDTEDPLATMGLLKLISPEIPNVNVMQFADIPHFQGLAGNTFSVTITNFNPQTGDIEFNIPGAANVFNPNTPPDYQFFFEGIYAYDDKTGKMELNGSGKVPQDFYPPPSSPGKKKSGPPGGGGEDVSWTSKGPGDPKHKHSK